MNRKATLNLVNLIAFQGVWLITVLGAAEGNLWYGIFALGIFIVAHQFLSVTAATDFKLVAIAVLFGAVIETLFIQTGLLSYAYNFPAADFAPIWVLILWANLALTLNGCLRWLQGRYLLASVLGAIGGPIAYLGGLKLGAAESGASTEFTLGIIAIVYGLIVPVLLITAKRLSVQHYLRERLSLSLCE
jgi:hypothetical protein